MYLDINKTAMKVNFIFIRHAESCQQVAHDYSPEKNFRFFYHKFTDPTISDVGVSDSIKTGNYLALGR